MSHYDPLSSSPRRGPCKVKFHRHFIFVLRSACGTAKLAEEQIHRRIHRKARGMEAVLVVELPAFDEHRVQVEREAAICAREERQQMAEGDVVGWRPPWDRDLIHLFVATRISRLIAKNSA